MTFKGISIDGVDDLGEMLTGFAPREAESLLRGTVQGTASKVAKAIRRNAPRGATKSLKSAKKIRAVRRRPVGNLVFSDIKADPKDAFYWRFVEHGTPAATAKPFVNPVIEEFRPELPKIYRSEFGKRLEKKLARRAKKAVKRV